MFFWGFDPLTLGAGGEIFIIRLKNMGNRHPDWILELMLGWVVLNHPFSSGGLEFWTWFILFLWTSIRLQDTDSEAPNSKSWSYPASGWTHCRYWKQFTVVFKNDEQQGENTRIEGHGLRFYLRLVFIFSFECCIIVWVNYQLAIHNGNSSCFPVNPIKTLGAFLPD